MSDGDDEIILDEDEWFDERQHQTLSSSKLSKHDRTRIGLEHPARQHGPVHKIHILVNNDNDHDLLLKMAPNSELGAQVTSLSEEAQAAGFMVGDFVISLNGVDTRSARRDSGEADVTQRILSSPRPLTITVQRAGSPSGDVSSADVSFEWDIVIKGQRIGLALDNSGFSNGAGDELVVVRADAPIAHDHGVRCGDVVLAMDGERIELGTHHTDFARRVSEAPRPLKLTFYRPARSCSASPTQESSFPFLVSAMNLPSALDLPGMLTFPLQLQMQIPDPVQNSEKIHFNGGRANDYMHELSFPGSDDPLTALGEAFASLTEIVSAPATDVHEALSGLLEATSLPSM